MSSIVQSKLPCPHPGCGSSDAYHIWDDGHGYCFSCGKPTFPKGVFEDLQYTYEYLPIRGINKKTLEFYDVKTKIDAEGKPIAIGFKYPNGSYKVRLLAEKHFKWEGESKAGLFGRNLFATGTRKYVVITEGEFDALSLYQVLPNQTAVVSVRSSSSALSDCTAARSYLNTFERIYLAFDNDAVGRDAVRSCAKLFDYNKVLVLDFDRRKDANEYLEAGEEDQLRLIFANAKKYLPETIVSSFHEFDKILSEKPREGIPYPFPTLNHMTYGIRKGESVLICAQEGVGKTELMRAIEMQLLEKTDDPIGAIFLEEPKRRHLQGLAGLYLRCPAHLPDSGITEDQVRNAVKAACRKDERLHLYSHFGSDDPDVILDTIRFMVSARSCGYVLLDHVSMVVSGLAGEDERRALDYLSTRLEMMVKELDFALIMVSHVNDMGQTRGSRYISKVCDIRLDASRDLMSGNEVERNTTRLRVSKNRFSGRTGDAGQLLFDPGTYQYTEIANDNDPSTIEGSEAA
jgi:twinkle protein